MPHLPGKSPGFEALRYLMMFAAAVIMLGSVVVAALVIARLDAPVDRLVIIGVAILSAGAAVGLALFALAAVVALQQSQLQKSRLLLQSLEHLHLELASIQPPASPSPSPALQVPSKTAPSQQGDLGEQFSCLQEEIRDLALMNDAQRRAAAAGHWAERKRALLAELERAMNLGEWNDAQARLETLKQISPDDPNIAALDSRIAAERTARLEGDIAVAENQLRHAMSISAWEQADDVIADLRRKYPAAAEVQELADYVEHEREAFNRDHTDRLFLDLSQATEHRQWKRALEIGEEIARRYPSDQRVEKLEHDLATIRENAAAQDRKEQEELFKDLLRRQRYHDALEVARALIDKYPASPAANELLRLIPKVEDLLRSQRQQREQITETT